MSTLSRRHALRLSTAALASAALASRRAGAATPAPRRACIVLYMHGGPSQIDTFDPKPGRPTGGPFAAIRTAVTGERISEHLPRIAARLDRLAIVRSLTSTEGNHDRARHLMHTGYAPAGGTPYPALGAWASAHAEPGDLPRHVAIGSPGQSAGMLGAAHGPLVIRRATRGVPDLQPRRPVSSRRQADRDALAEALHDDFAAAHADPVVVGHGTRLRQARRMMSPAATAAFDLDREPAALHEAYGGGEFGQGCLLARRLVEAGAAWVEVGLRGWDTHEDAFDRVRTLSGELDQGMSALLDDLDSRGLLDETLVWWVGDFGRTPRINARGGRDHYPRVTSTVLSGAGIPGGVVVGRTDADGHEIVDAPVTVPDLARTIALRLGLDPDETRITPGGRPISTVDGGRPIAALVG